MFLLVLHCKHPELSHPRVLPAWSLFRTRRHLPLTPGAHPTQPSPPKPTPLREEARQADDARDQLNKAWLRKGHTYSESGDSSEMLWEVAERGVKGHIAEGVEEVCTAEGVTVV